MGFVKFLIALANLELLTILVLALGWGGLFFWLCYTALAALFTRVIRLASGNETAQAIVEDAESCVRQDVAGLRR